MEVSTPFGAYGATDPLFLLLAALAIEAYAGDVVARLPKLRHPRALVARVAIRLERKLNKPQRSQRALIVRGAVVTVALAALAAGAGLVLAVLVRDLPFVWVVELFLLVTLVDQRTSARQALGASRALADDDTTEARRQVRALAGEGMDPQRIDQLEAHGLGLAAVRGLGKRFAAAVLAPVFWFVLLGLPGIFLQQTVRAVATVVATGNRPGGGGVDLGREGDFAFPALRLDRALEWLPDRLAGLILTLASVFVPGTHPMTALRRLPKARSWSIGALGGALALAARADASFASIAEAGEKTLRRAVAIFGVGCLINAGLVAALVLLRQAV